MNTYYIIGGIVILILIVFTGLTVLDKPANTAENATAEEITKEDVIIIEENEEEGTPTEQFVITYDGSSFSPSPITITKGQTVTWANEGSHSMWIASAMHPTHTAYPETSANDCFGSSFDACSGVAPGDSWSFTFDSVGEWGYHNHLRTSNFGKVIVE